MDFFDPDFIPNGSDNGGRYTYVKQPGREGGKGREGEGEGRREKRMLTDFQRFSWQRVFRRS
jgi:hypothetical protein